MTFLQPALLLALPLAALPVIIHLIHLYRRRQIKWAAMIFLRKAQKMNKGLSRLRQILILTLRVLAVAAILLVIARPLAGGWLGLTGGAPDTVLILLDRSSSMEQQNLASGVSKRLAGLQNLAKALTETVGTRSKLVLIDSALGQAEPLEQAKALLDVPKTEATDTAADIPALLQTALDYITTNKTGRTDVWLLSDLQQSDWDAASGRWETLRTAFATLQGVRFHLLAYPERANDDLAIRIDRVVRREGSEKAEILLDLRISRKSENPQPVDLPLRVVLNGATTTLNVQLKQNELVLNAYPVPIDKATKQGWGRIELPADVNSRNNVFHFVFDEPPPLRSVIVSDDEAEAAPLKAALSAAADPSRKYEATVLSANQAAEIPWEETALIVWQAPIPKKEEALARQLKNHVANGRSILFLPPDTGDEPEIFGLRWADWETSDGAKPGAVEWWRNDSDLLANTRDGAALPVGSLEISRQRAITGPGIPLARMAGNRPLLLRSTETKTGSAYFLGTLPGPGSSSLARDGVVLFALLHRALNEGAHTLGRTQQRLAGAEALGGDRSKWHSVEQKDEVVLAENLPLRAGVLSASAELVALNRPPGEDQTPALSSAAVSELFAGLDFRLLTDSLSEGRSLTNEVWRTFLIAMGLALFFESLLCMPPPREKAAVRTWPAAAEAPKEAVR